MHNIYPEQTKISAIKEIKTILDRNTIEGIEYNKIPKGKKVIYIMTRYTEKFKNGAFDKIKSRLLLGGDKLSDEFQSRWDEINARTVSLSSLFTLVSVYAKEFEYRGCMDFQSAFLYAELPEEDQCYGKIPKEESRLIVEINPEWEKFLSRDKTIYCKVKGALYGHPLAPKLWYNYLKAKLALIGFQPMKSEECVFVRIRERKRTIISLHVDDGFIGSEDEHIFEELKQFLSEHFKGEGTVQVSDNLEYLNMLFAFNRSDKSVVVSQQPYWAKVVEKFNCVEVKDMPHNCKYGERLGNDPSDHTGIELDKIKFMSLIMSIMWGAKRTQPSILFNVTSLATMCKRANKLDFDDANHLLQYINNHKDDYIRLKIEGNVQLSVFVDSSSSLYYDGKGHGGHVIILGNSYGGPVEVCSNKSKLVGRSSMEYELFALHNMLPSLLFLKDFLEELGYKQEPIKIFEDNRSLVDLIKAGKKSSGVSKHISSKYYYSRELIEKKVITFVHCPSDYMLADMLTKPLNGPKYKCCNDSLRNKQNVECNEFHEMINRLYRGNIKMEFHDAQVANMLVDTLIKHR